MLCRIAVMSAGQIFPREGKVSMGKKIAVLSTPWSHEHIGGVLNGMKKKAMEIGADIYVFNNYGGFESDETYNAGEHHIFKLPNLTMFDGVLLALNDVSSMEHIAGLVEKIRQNGIPCICIDQEMGNVFFLGTDNYSAMYEMVEHLVTAHHCRILNYVGGPAEHVENCLRKQAFRDVLKKYGLPVEEERIRDYYYTTECGRNAYKDFDRIGLAMPDAVVCANDQMAIGYADMVFERGFRVPEDILVTGFDYSSEGQNDYPEIASVERGRENLGYAAVESLLDVIGGKELPQKTYVPHHLRPNCSCGCRIAPETYAKVRRKRAKAEKWVETSRWQINLVQKILWVCEDEEEYRRALYDGLEAFNIHNFCILINDGIFDKEHDFAKEKDEDEDGYPERMRLFFWTRELNPSKETWVETSALIPDGFADPEAASHVFVVMPVHMRGIHFGYCVMEEGLEHIVDGNLVYLLGVINSSLEHVRQNAYIRKINRQLRHMYMMDALTGVYNRFALNAFAEPLLKANAESGKGTLFLFSDMDGLKAFNDTYGHDVGDKAIKYLAGIMKEACADDSCFCIRYGGDEFLMIGNCADAAQAEEMKKRLEDRIAAFNREGKLPDVLAASFGYIFAEPDGGGATIDYYISKADEMMYQIKKKKKLDAGG